MRGVQLRRTIRGIAILLSILLIGGAGGAVVPVGDGDQGALTPMQRLRELSTHGTGTSELKASCCKRCSKGKACGDSCIARDKTCRKGAGCACDG